MHSDIDICCLGTGAVLSLYCIDASVVSISISNKQAAGSDARGDLNVNHDSLVNLFAVFVPYDLGNRPSCDAAAEFNVLSGPQSQLLLWRPLNLRGNCRSDKNQHFRTQRGHAEEMKFQAEHTALILGHDVS